MYKSDFAFVRKRMWLSANSIAIPDLRITRLMKERLHVSVTRLSEEDLYNLQKKIFITFFPELSMFTFNLFSSLISTDHWMAIGTSAGGWCSPLIICQLRRSWWWKERFSVPQRLTYQREFLDQSMALKICAKQHYLTEHKFNESLYFG